MSSNTLFEGSIIVSWHAHIYFDSKRRDEAWKFREVIAKHIGDKVRIGNFNEGPIGPHPVGSYELFLFPRDFRAVIEWLVLNHGTLDVLVHPNTDDELRDHRDSASWIGHSYKLNLDILHQEHH